MGNEVLALLDDPDCTKILCCVDDEGAPHPAVKGSLQSENENILYLEFIESSKTNRYMTRSLWFDKKVSELILTPDKKFFDQRPSCTRRCFRKIFSEILQSGLGKIRP